MNTTTFTAPAVTKSVPTANGIPNAHTGHSTERYIVPTAMLADTIEPEIAKREARKTHDEAAGPGTGTGVLREIAAGASVNVGASEDGVFRRLYAVRNLECRATDTEMADAILGELDLMIEHTDLPTMPAGKIAALEMVDCYLDARGETMTPIERQRLARTLLNFTLGFIADNETDAPDIEEWARSVASTRIRRSRTMNAERREAAKWYVEQKARRSAEMHGGADAA